jgi:DNA replication and repair protein RecF
VWLRRLDIERFRNIESTALDLSAGFNFFYGENGAGKTALLEAVHVLARGRSFRTQQNNELIQVGADAFVIRATAEDEHRGRQQLALTRNRNSKTELRINGEAGRKMSQAATLLPLEVMVPTMVELVFGGPALRRQWLDWGVFHVKPQFLNLLRRYVASLRQRNACLKGLASGALKVGDLSPWTAELVALALAVDTARRAHLDTLRPIIARALETLSLGLEVGVSYRQGWADGGDLDKLLSESLSREVKSGATLLGPHRADVEFRVHGMAGAGTLSRGQAKILASALMLAQAEVAGSIAKRASVFLIDDIGAELDERHRRELFGALVRLGCQVLATSVQPPDERILADCRDYAMFHVKHGEVEERAGP